MSGMVITPVVTTFDTALPEIEPNRPEATTAILACPPRKRPTIAMAICVKNSEPPDFSSTWPKNT